MVGVDSFSFIFKHLIILVPRAFKRDISWVAWKYNEPSPFAGITLKKTVNGETAMSEVKTLWENGVGGNRHESW
jgi:hypothetical protein